MEILESIVNTGNTLVWSTPSVFPWMIVALLGTGLFITLYLGFIQLRRVGHAVRVVLGKYDDDDDPGDVTHFQALSTALSATVGIGNIAGVAIAIHLGGPGAVFWMWLTALFGMALKFAECTLAVEYRTFDDNGDVAGGPMYYIEKGLGKAWKPLAVVFAFCAIVSSFGGGNMNQANTVAQSAAADLGTPTWIIGLALVGIVGAVILGGIRSIAAVSSRLAPSMAVLYVGAALLILIFNVTDIPSAFGTIFSNAFNPTAGVTGAGTGGLLVALTWGVRRGLFSNEAGQGSAPIAHAAAKTDEPVREGAVAMLEPLIDTLIICTMTALVIVITGVWDQKQTREFSIDQVEVSVADAEGLAAGDYEQALTVVGGMTSPSLQFSAVDAPIDSPKIFVTRAEGPPIALTGIVVVKRRGDTWSIAVTQGPEHIGVTVHGAGLLTGSQLTAWGFQKGLSPIGDWGNWVVTICVFLFAISTMISWSYYGDRCVTYLFGTKFVIVYRLVFIGFVYIGATTALEVVWNYGDLALGLMTIPNLIAVALLSPKVVSMTRDYFRRMDKLPKATVKSGGNDEG